MELELELELVEIELQAVEAKSVAQTSSTYRGMGSDVEQWLPLVAGHFSDLGQDAVDMAMRIMACESGGNTHARNPRSTATGLMQIMYSVWGPEFGFSRDDLEVPEINLWVARQVYERQGWDAWTCWKR
jgi:soluble lytic murein transglycosylase-like protein